MNFTHIIKQALNHALTSMRIHNIDNPTPEQRERMETDLRRQRESGYHSLWWTMHGIWSPDIERNSIFDPDFNSLYRRVIFEGCVSPSRISIVDAPVLVAIHDVVSAALQRDEFQANIADHRATLGEHFMQ